MWRKKTKYYRNCNGHGSANLSRAKRAAEAAPAAARSAISTAAAVSAVLVLSLSLYALQLMLNCYLCLYSKKVSVTQKQTKV